jgi:hypothetical protein
LKVTSSEIVSVAGEREGTALQLHVNAAWRLSDFPKLFPIVLRNETLHMELKEEV